MLSFTGYIKKAFYLPFIGYPVYCNIISPTVRTVEIFTVPTDPYGGAYGISLIPAK